MSTQQTDPESKTDVTRDSHWAASLAVIGCIVTGLASFIGGLYALGEASGSSPVPFVGAGVCWTASGLAFGMLANAIFRR